MRAGRAITFPYKAHKGISCPIIPIEILEVRIDADIDTGAYYSIFSTKEAEALGIEYQSGKKSSATVGDGNLIPVFYHTLPIKIGNIPLPAIIGFSPRLGIGFNLLGRKDIFERFVVVFDDIKQIVTFIPRK